MIRVARLRGRVEIGQVGWVALRELRELVALVERVGCSDLMWQIDWFGLIGLVRRVGEVGWSG